MPAPAQPLPQLGENNAAADPKIRSVLAELQSILAGNLDGANIGATLRQLFYSPGDIKASARANPEAGWLPCDGTETPAPHADLMAALAGNPYGVGAGGRPLLPDLRGRMLVGKGAHAEVDTLGESDGLAVNARRPRHQHEHMSPIAMRTGAIQVFEPSAAVLDTWADSNYRFETTADGHLSREVGAGVPNISEVHIVTSNSSGPAYMVVNFFIKT